MRVNDVDLEYVEQGSGDPVGFCHGSASDVRYWEPQRDAFASRYRFVAYSRRFHGKATWPSQGDHSHAAHVSDLLAIIREVGRAHLVAFSTAIGLRAALAAPELFRSVTIVEPNVPWLLDGDTEGEAARARWRAENDRVLADSAGDELTRAKLWFDLVNNRGRGAFDAQAKDLQRMWFDNFASPRPAAAAGEAITCSDLAAIAVPTLAVGSEFGMSYSRLILDRVAACIPGSQLVIIPGATHFMSYQHPVAFNGVVLDFIARH